jgi:hypothetical protein
MPKGLRRPSGKERDKKLRDAIAALENGRYLFIDADRHLPQDMAELGSEDPEDHLERIWVFLKEIQKAGGGDYYVGTYPPQRCYHNNFQDLELYAFAWDSPSADKRMYLKFGIRLSKKNSSPTFLYLDCHEDDPKKTNR